MNTYLRNPVGQWGYTHLTSPEDMLWFNEGLKAGYRLPSSAPFWMRRWGIRHVRWLWRTARVEIDAITYAKIGVVMDGRDGWICYAIWKGWI